MTTTKRQRGRPIGSGEKDEGPLSEVADLIIRAQAARKRLTASSAMRQVIRARNVVGASPEAALRRLQRKWRYQKEALLAAARHRETERNTPRQTVDASSYTRATHRLADIYGDYGTASRRLAEMANGHMSASRRLAEMASSYADPLKTIEKALNPASEVIRKMDEMNQRIRDLVDPPSLRFIREITANLNRITGRGR